MVTATLAREWIERWDRQQETYLADREERFAVIADVVRASCSGAAPLVVDLGCGPGSLSTRLVERVPGARVLGVDADELLLGLADAAYGAHTRLRFVAADLRAADWPAALELDGPVDAVVSTTALHWLTRPELAALYATVGGLLRPGGVFVNGDHFTTAHPALEPVVRGVRDGRIARVPRTEAEDWQQWWSAIGADDDLDALLGTRGARPIEHHVDDLPTYEDHVAFLHDADFTAVDSVWQYADDRVLVGVR